MVEWWLSLRSESERFLLLFALAPDPAFRSLGGNLKTSHVSSSNFKFYPLKERGESSKFQKPWGFANAQNSSKKIPGTPYNLARYYLFSLSIQKPYYVPVALHSIATIRWDMS